MTTIRRRKCLKRSVFDALNLEEQMSKLHNDNGFSERKSSLPMSLQNIIAERTGSIYANSYKRTDTRCSSVPKRCVVAEPLRGIAQSYPSVKSEQDVDKAADYLVELFHSPESRRFYCDVARHLTDTKFIEQAIKCAFQPKVKSPPAYFGRICVNRLVKLGFYKQTLFLLLS